MSTVQLPTFFFGTRPMHSIWRDGESWFLAKDVCDILDLANISKALDKLDEDEKGITNWDTPGGKQDVLIVSEAGAYRLAFTSRKPEAKAFARWLSHEVLPAIRKTGRYEAARVERQSVRDDTRNSLRVRYAKLALVNVAMRLEELGIDAATIDMGAVVRFGRSLQAIGSPRQ